MRKLVLILAIVLTAGCSPDPMPEQASQHPGKIGGEQAAKNSNIGKRVGPMGCANPNQTASPTSNC